VGRPLLLVAEYLHVGDVLRSPGGALVFDERAAPDHGYLATLEVEAFTICDGLSKSDAVGTIDDVDPPWGNAELEYAKTLMSARTDPKPAGRPGSHCRFREARLTRSQAAGPH
jgi:hypothetical protein